MSDYVKSTNFYSKDALISGNPNKIIKGAELDDEFNNIATAVATKADLNSPTFTGIPSGPTATAGTSTTQFATTAFVQNVAGSLGTLSSQNASSVAITGGTITGTTISGITDIAVADGGTGVSTIAANAVVLGNGTNAIQTVSPGTSGNILTSNGTTWTSSVPVGGLGVGQSYSDVTSSRALGTTYTNSTGKPISVMVFVSISNGSAISGYCNGLNVVTSSQFAGGGTFITWIVPAGSTYSASGAYSSLAQWTELR